MTSTAPPQIHRTDVDGVPVYWADTPGRLEAHLYFRVGVRDESFATTGITHLIEHLAYSRLPAIKHEHNGQVELGLTTFSATGRPEAVAATLEDLCGSLGAIAAGDVAPELLATELRVLEAEGSLAVPPHLAEALGTRYGLRGLGLAAAEPVFAERLTRGEVAEFAASFFTRGNAALVLSGPPPEGLRLPLPEGTRDGWETTPTAPQALPAEYVSGGDGLVLSFSLPGDGSPLVGAVAVLGTVLGDRVRATLRRGRGLVYDLDFGCVAVTPERALAVVTCELKPANAVVVAREILSTLRDLRDRGVTADELADVLAAFEEAGDDPQLPLWEARDEALRRIGVAFQPPHDRLLAAIGSVTARDMELVLADLEWSLLVGLPEESLPEGDDADGVLYPRPAHRPADVGPGTEYRRGIAGAVAMGVPRDARLSIGEGGLRMAGGGTVHAFGWEDIAGVAWEAPAKEGAARRACTVIGRDGFVVSLVSGWFRGGDRALAAIADRVPARLQYTETVDARRES